MFPLWILIVRIMFATLCSMRVRTKNIILNCEFCGTEFRRRDKPRANRGRFCSPRCVGLSGAERSRENLTRLRKTPEFVAKLNEHLYSSTNPFNTPEVRAKSAASLKKRGYHNLDGGNGRPLSVPHSMLAARLGWPTEYAVSLGKRLPNYPTCYKLDIANPAYKIGIEVDGYSHKTTSIKAKDAKKEDRLSQLGWTVLRFSNQSILDDLESVVAEIMAAVKSST